MKKWLILFTLALTTLEARPDQRTLDVVIIGGGICGTYTGWKLATNGKKDVHIFEGSERIGGRIHTTFFDKLPDTPVELGASHFRSSHTRVKKVIDHFDLPTITIDQQQPKNIRFLRGKRFLVDQGYDDLPYALAEGEKGKSPRELIDLAVSRVKNGSLDEISWQSLLLNNLSPEAFQLLADLQEMQLVADVSAKTALAHLSQDGAFAVASGNDQLPKKLASAFEEAGGKINLKHHLMSVSYEGEKENFRYRLLFYEADGSFKPVYAKHLIFTITPPALKLLAQQAPAFKDKQFQDNLEELVSVPLTQIYLAYDTPWWTKLGITGGESITTLPLTRCIYSNSPYLCASSSQLYDAFWESFSEGKPAKQNVGENALWQVQKQLQIVHGVDIPEPAAGMFVDWSDAPHFGAYFFWRTGAKGEELAQYFQHPFVGEPLYIIGSAYSQQQGTVEGALESADSLLKNYFFIP